MLVGMTPAEKQKFMLTKAEDYHYLIQGNCLSCEGMDDVEEFSTIRGSMKVSVTSQEEVNLHENTLILIGSSFGELLCTITIF